MLSTISPLPSRYPRRALGRRWGALLMLSWPPATMTSASPALIACAATMAALSEDPQTLFRVKAPTVSGRPPLRAACRAGFWPVPAWMTWPMMHSSTMSGSTLARDTASSTARAPSSVAWNPLRSPWNFPTGVRTAEAMTTSRMGITLAWGVT